MLGSRFFLWILELFPDPKEATETKERCVHVQSFSWVQLSSGPWTAARQALCPRDSPGKDTGAGCRFLFQGIFPHPGIEPTSPALSGEFFTTVPPGKPIKRWGDPY